MIFHQTFFCKEPESLNAINIHYLIIASDKKPSEYKPTLHRVYQFAEERDAGIYGVTYFGMSEMPVFERVQLKDLPLYMSGEYKTTYYEKALKGETLYLGDKLV